jgi:hypothetical protein
MAPAGKIWLAEACAGSLIDLTPIEYEGSMRRSSGHPDARGNRQTKAPPAPVSIRTRQTRSFGIGLAIVFAVALTLNAVSRSVEPIPMESEAPATDLDAVMAKTEQCDPRDATGRTGVVTAEPDRCSTIPMSASSDIWPLDFRRSLHKLETGYSAHFTFSSWRV